METKEYSRKTVFHIIVFIVMLFIPWYIMTFGTAHPSDDIMTELMKKSLYGGLFVYFVEIIMIFFRDDLQRNTLLEKLFLKEIVCIFLICAAEYWLIWCFLVIRGTVYTVILINFHLSEALFGWIITLIVLGPFVYLLRKWL